jgi:hypothetical protein
MKKRKNKKIFFGLNAIPLINASTSCITRLTCVMCNLAICRGITLCVDSGEASKLRSTYLANGKKKPQVRVTVAAVVWV